MRRYYTSDEVQAAETPLLESLPDGTLMRRAAYGLAQVVARELKTLTGGVTGRSVTVIVGSGDNGGDALWAGALLRKRGVTVRAVLLSPDRAHAKGLAALRRSGGCVVSEVGTPDLVIDGIVGISGHGPLRPHGADVVGAVRAPIVAADLPSGVDPNTGAVTGPAVTAAVTVAFGALKPVHVLAPANCGRVELIDIGLEPGEAWLASLEASDVGRLWPTPGPSDDKYTQGVVGVVAGSAGYPGAGVLCTGAAVAATSGMVRYAGPCGPEVLAQWPEVIATADYADAGRVQAWVVGPGIGTDTAADRVVRALSNTDVPVLLDADALTLVSKAPEIVRNRTAPTVLTPHAGEFARLTGTEPDSDRVAAVRDLARSWGVTVLLKGHSTVIADPSGRTLVNEAGGSWASTAGAGDVLSGMIGALLSAGLTPIEAAAAGARAHSLAANVAAHGGGTDLTAGSGTAPVSAGLLLSQVREAIRILRAAPRPEHGATGIAVAGSEQ